MGFGARQASQSIFSLENHIIVDYEDIPIQTSLFYGCETEDQGGKGTSQGMKFVSRRASIGIPALLIFRHVVLPLLP